MKRCFIGILVMLILTLIGCSNNNSDSIIKFAISSEYPPFEYQKNGEFRGFDIDLAKLICKELHKKVVFEDMQFSTILTSLQSNSVDAAISTITITPERKKNFDFSDPYYTESISAVFLKSKPITNVSELSGKKIACQLGTTIEIWLRKHVPDSEIITMDNNNQTIEALKSGHVDCALADTAQGATFSKKNSNLSYAVIAKSDAGYGIAFKKGCVLKDQVNEALKRLDVKGEIKKLEFKWLGGTQ